MRRVPFGTSGVAAVVLIALGTGAWTASAQAQETALSELGTAHYQGWMGGLYPGGSNHPPPAHVEQVLAAVAAIQPRAASGLLDEEGWIGVAVFGMSNTSQESKHLEWLIETNPAVRGEVRFVNTAQGGVVAEQMANPGHAYWPLVDARLAAAGLSPAQVQVCVLKQALGNVPDPNFPTHVQTLETHLEQILRLAKQRYPNLRLCYLGNRIYGGYSDRVDRGEPITFESGFAVQRVIARQIEGDPLVAGEDMPRLLWLHDNWAPGSTPRADGLAWLMSDYEADRIHPSLQGEAKIAQRWHQALLADQAAAHWLLRRSSDPERLALTPAADATIHAGQPTANFGADGNLQLGWPSAGVEVRGLLRFDVPAELQPPTAGRLFLHALNPVNFELWPLAAADFDESSITWNNAPAAVAPMLATGPVWNVDGSVALAVPVDGMQAASSIGYALRRTATLAVQRVASREAAALPPTLVLRLPRNPSAVFADGFEAVRLRAVGLPQAN